MDSVHYISHVLCNIPSSGSFKVGFNHPTSKVLAHHCLNNVILFVNNLTLIENNYNIVIGV